MMYKNNKLKQSFAYNDFSNLMRNWSHITATEMLFLDNFTQPVWSCLAWPRDVTFPTFFHSPCSRDVYVCCCMYACLISVGASRLVHDEARSDSNSVEPALIITKLLWQSWSLASDKKWTCLYVRDCFFYAQQVCLGLPSSLMDFRAYST